MVRTPLYALLLAGGALVSGSVLADTLLVEGLQKTAASEPQRPERGMSKQAVETSYGEPVTRHSAVGDPPIARWDYGNFIVYFEYDHVIHAVALNR